MMHLSNAESKRSAAAGPDEHLAGIEAAMVAIRRSQSRRTLARLARQATHEPAVLPDTALYDVLDAVEAAEEAGEQATVSTVGAALDLAQPRASKLVAAAVDAGLVRREADQADGRRALLVRTDEGRAVSDDIHRFRRRNLAAAMDGWPAQDRAEFARLLTSFVAGLPKP